MSRPSTTTMAAKIAELQARRERLEIELAAQKAITASVEQEYKQDARRYRQLRVIGAAPSTSRQLKDGTVLVATNLDEFVDEELRWHPYELETKNIEIEVLTGTVSEFRQRIEQLEAALQKQDCRCRYTMPPGSMPINGDYPGAVRQVCDRCAVLAATNGAK